MFIGIPRPPSFVSPPPSGGGETMEGRKFQYKKNKIKKMLNNKRKVKKITVKRYLRCFILYASLNN